MTIPKIKQILRAARAAGLDYKRKKAEADRYIQKLESGRTVRYKNSRYERSGNTVEINLCIAADCTMVAEAAGKVLAEPYIKASRLINLVKDNKQHEVLDRYYLHCQSWNRIAGDMGYTYRHVKRLHGYALEKIYNEFSKNS